LRGRVAGWLAGVALAVLAASAGSVASAASAASATSAVSGGSDVAGASAPAVTSAVSEGSGGSAATDGAGAPFSAPALVVYMRDGCPHCADAKAFVAGLQLQRPALRVEWRDVGRDPAAAEALDRVFRANGQWPPGVPTFVLGRALWVGFDDAAHSGRVIESMLDAAGVRAAAGTGAAAATGAAPAAPAAQPAPSATTTDPAGPAADRPGRRSGEVDTRWFGTLSASSLGLPLFTLALGLLDGFNPCAMWVLLFLLSLLVRLQDRRRIALVAGSFVLASGAVYYAFMAAWLNLFLLVGWSDALRWTLAALALAIGAINAKDALAPDHGPSLAIPASARPSLVARMHRVVHAPGLATMLAGVAALALVVNTVELLCTAGLPALYTAVLAQQGVGDGARLAWLGLYILAYMADDALMVGVAVVALGRGKLGARAGRALKGLSGAVMLVLGALLLWRPQWLM
jgi:glutaredoxin